ncbi:unnamed protein product [Rangifer tarandus platyrhynchus]|uniref:Uncharacterized protein n=1 Tax=Rangifer tarandus platyrhynchus TaxID=3082113 RepID=A0AC59ZTW7_RANTA
MTTTSTQLLQQTVGSSTEQPAQAVSQQNASYEAPPRGRLSLSPNKRVDFCKVPERTSPVTFASTVLPFSEPWFSLYQRARGYGTSNKLNVQQKWIPRHRKRQLPLGALRTHESRLPSRKPKKKKGKERKEKGGIVESRASAAAHNAAPSSPDGLGRLRSAPRHSQVAQPSDPAAGRALPAGGDLRCVSRPRRSRH